jgi:methylmalonyl-CoA mutase
MHYERMKHDGTLPIVGVNTFKSDKDEQASQAKVALIRSSEEEKQAQVAAVKAFQARHSNQRDEALRKLQHVATTGGNVFSELLDTVRHCSLRQISHALYEVGGQYRRSV